MPAPEACLPAFAPDPRPVTKVPNAPVSNSLGLKKLGGVTCVDRLGDVVKVPKRAARIETPDHEREIPRQDKTQEEIALPQGRQIALRLERVGEIEEAAAVYAERKIEELAEHKLRFEKPELAQKWDKGCRHHADNPTLYTELPL
jgi:hypothetical protein